VSCITEGLLICGHNLHFAARCTASHVVCWGAVRKDNGGWQTGRGGFRDDTPTHAPRLAFGACLENQGLRLCDSLIFPPLSLDERLFSR